MLAVNRVKGVTVFEIDEDYQEAAALAAIDYGALSGDGANPFTAAVPDTFVIHGFVGPR